MLVWRKNFVPRHRKIVVLQCNFKRFTNILNSEILLNLIRKMKYLTDQFQLCFLFALATLNSSDVVEAVTFETKTSLKLRDRGFIKNSETETRDFKICGFCRNFSKKCRHRFPSWFFSNFSHFSHLFSWFLACKYKREKTRCITVLLSHIVVIFQVPRQCDRDLKPSRPETFEACDRDLKPSRPRLAKLDHETILETETKSRDSTTAK